MSDKEWIAVGEKWPYEDCDVKLRAGSILKNVIHQSDRDFYWKAPFGEIFVCEFSVTHWMPLPAPPEPKPRWLW